MLLRISETVDDVHCNDCVLYGLINFHLQITCVEDIGLKNSNRIDEVLVTGLNM